MSAKTRLSSPAVDAQAKALSELLDGGFFDVMTGSQPDSADESVPDDLRLASCPLAGKAFSAPKDGVLKANSISKTIAIRTGEPTWFRLRTRSGIGVIDGAREDMGLKVNMLVEGQTVGITEYTHRVTKDFD